MYTLHGDKNMYELMGILSMRRDKEAEAPGHAEEENSLPEQAVLHAKGTPTQANEGGMHLSLFSKRWMSIMYNVGCSACVKQ